MTHKHRKPNLPFEKSPPGTCMWCGEKIGLTPKGRESKANWHKKCLTEYRDLSWPSKVRKKIWKRDKGVCKKCGHESSYSGGMFPWHADHIIPLIESSGDKKYWEMSNLQTLCSECHIEKTSTEATARALSRKLFN